MRIAIKRAAQAAASLIGVRRLIFEKEEVRNMKKVWSLVLVLAMVLSLAGCTVGGQPTGGNNGGGGSDGGSGEGGSFYAGKTVTVIVPWAAGGGADTAARLVCDYAEDILGCTIVVNNVSGGGGSIGLQQLTDSNPDGLTFAYVANTDSNGDVMLEGITYTVDSFAPVCVFAEDPHVIVASKKSGITDLETLKAAGADGSTTWGIGGAWTHWDFLKMEFEEATSTSYKRIVYDGGTTAITDVASGDCDVATPFISEAMSQIDAGNVVPIAVTSAERNESCPDIPTLAEQGLEGFDSTMWRGFVAPAGTPEDAMREFAEAIGEACENPELLERAQTAGTTISFIGYDDFQTYYMENHESVRAYVESADF